MRDAYLRTRIKEITRTVDKATGEIEDIEIKSHKYMVNTKEEFLLIYSTLIGVFQKMSTAEVRVYAYLLQYYPAGGKIVINDIIRQDIMNSTNLKAGSINNTLIKLTSTTLSKHPLLYRLGRGTYQMNPRFAFKRVNDYQEQ